MSEKVIYLDSSAIIKRYIREENSDRMVELYTQAYQGDIKLAFSLWNIGEVLGAFDRAKRIKRIDVETYELARLRFLSEILRMKRLGILKIIPLYSSILIGSWELLEKYHIYQADAIQIESARRVNASEFYTADKRLHQVALSEDLNSFLI
ncbi:type II toxin-antitoxin system VapC family toxin [Pyrococcus horikoshii]|nr:type II toxin-antitoxin system VapC family toxin [Pyrococcus horikoshii]HII61544.1 type II toxin-antitoxin system VapC family toxin [Pyrococcus horikoshii]